MDKETAKSIIDLKSATVRKCYITEGTGQEATYLMKIDDVNACINSNFTNIPLLVKAEMDATSQSAQDVCSEITNDYYKWKTLAALIEKIRRSGKITIDACEDPNEYETILEQTLDQLSALMPQ